MVLKLMIGAESCYFPVWASLERFKNLVSVAKNHVVV